jgi:hypothetical protein
VGTVSFLKKYAQEVAGRRTGFELLIGRSSPAAAGSNEGSCTGVVRVASRIYIANQGGGILTEVSGMTAANHIGGRPWQLMRKPKIQSFEHPMT